MPVKTIKLNDGTQMPVVGLGTWQSIPGDVEGAVEIGLNLGYTHIDIAKLYCNEKEVGKIYTKVWSEGKIKRSDVYIVSKLWSHTLHKDDIIPACKGTLADLQLEYLDLLLIHIPIFYDKNIVQTPFARGGIGIIGYTTELMKTAWQQMESLVEQGLVKSIGVSNFTVTKLKDLLEFARIKPVCNRVEMHPYLPQNTLKSYCDQNDIVCVAYAPLASPKRPFPFVSATEPRLLDEPVVSSIAEKHQCTPAQVLISWAIHRGTVVIPKSVTPKRIEENLKAADLSLSAEDMTALNEIKTRHRYFTQKFMCKPGQTVEEFFDGEILAD